MANLLHKYSQFSTIHVCVNQGRYLTKTVFAFFCSICPFTVPPPQTHTQIHTFAHIHTYKLFHTHTHIPLCPKASWAQKCLFCWLQKILVPKTRICPFSPSLQVSPSQISGGKKWERMRKEGKEIMV